MINEQVIALYAQSFGRPTVIAVQMSRADWQAISAEITQLRGNLNLAEEGLANYALEVERKNSLIDLQDEAQTSLHAENVRLRVEIEQHKRNLAWQSKEIDAQVQEIQRQQQQVVDLKSDYLRRHNDAVDRFEALTDIQREIAGCGPDCSKDFLRLALNTVMQIATIVLNRPSSKPGACAYIGAPDGKPEPCVRAAGHSGPHEHAKKQSVQHAIRCPHHPYQEMEKVMDCTCGLSQKSGAPQVVIDTWDGKP